MSDVAEPTPAPPGNGHGISVIVLGYGAEPLLADCLRSVAAQLGPEDECVLVDNGFRADDATRAEVERLARVVGPAKNRGFAGGCNTGAEAAHGDTLVFLNSDAILEPGALDALTAALDEPDVGIASGCLVLPDGKVNSVGNPVSYIGITWAGSMGDDVADHAEPRDITCATGGLFAIRRSTWERFGGFDDVYFAYHEDTDLSLRVRLSGLRVRYVPGARAVHHYEFSRNSFKMYLLERNRWLTVLADYPRDLRRRVLPAVVATEIPMFAVAVAQGWAKQKLRAWGWLLGHAGEIRRLRRKAEATTVLDSAAAAGLLVDQIDAPGAPRPPGMAALNVLLRAYWRVARPRG